MSVSSVNAKYKKYYDLYEQGRWDRAQEDINASNADYDEQARQTHLRNSRQNRELHESLMRHGITGGASETSLANASTNYQNQLGLIAANKAAAAQRIRAQARQDVNAYNLENSKLQETAVSNEQERLESKRRWNYNAKLAKKKRNESRFAKNIGGYTNISQIKKLMKKYKKNKKNRWKIPYLRKQLATAKKAIYGTAYSKGSSKSLKPKKKIRTYLGSNSSQKKKARGYLASTNSQAKKTYQNLAASVRPQETLSNKMNAYRDVAENVAASVRPQQDVYKAVVKAAKKAAPPKKKASKKKKKKK